MTTIGIMQGRLSPPVEGRLQSFPVRTWREEFARAREAGLACIEWIYEAETEADNPLCHDEGIAELQALARASGVAVWSVCADYFQRRLLVGADGEPSEAAVLRLIWLIGRCRAAGVRQVVLPFVDASSLRSDAQVTGVRSVLRRVAPKASRAGIELHLETDLPPDRLVALLEGLGQNAVRANYDTGNSASLGYDPQVELASLGPWLGSVHVKDRMLHGGSVPLGTGAVDFRTCFRRFHAAAFRGPYILQAAREEGVSETTLAARNRAFVERWLESADAAA